jgi:broad specificity phosphatase PhoE
MQILTTIYFVRHGESESNATRVFHGAASPLSANGEKQAEAVAKRFAHVPVDLVVTSSYPRALHTAQAITSVTGKPLVECPYIHERINPSSFHGLSYEDPKKRANDTEMYDHFAQGDRVYHFEDGESFNDLFERARQARTWLESRDERSLVVVTHGAFLRFLHAYFQFEDILTPQIVLRTYFGMRAFNTGVTVYDYVDGTDRRPDVGRWVLRTWMDVAHMAE